MPPNSFSVRGLSASLVRVLTGLRLTEPTVIQRKTIPHVLGSAETGSGKTAVFMLPLIERLEPGKIVRHQVPLEPLHFDHRSRRN